VDRAGSAMRSRSRHAVADADADIGTHPAGRSGLRRLAEVAFISLFFAVVLFAAVPMGANRDWAWSPIVVLLAVLAIWHALGLGITDGHAIRPVERLPLIVLIFGFVLVVVAGIVQISPLVPASWRSELYARAASVLGHPIEAMISINADASRAALMKIAATGAIFVMARATFRDRRRARLFLILFLATAILVTAYGLLMQATNGSCYVFSYSKRSDLAPPGREYLCALSGTFVNSNSYAAYTGMALVVALGLIFSRRPVSSEQSRGFATRPSLAAWLTGDRAVYMAMALLLFGGILLSESRAGFGATLLGAILLGTALLRGRWPSRPAVGWALAVAILFGAALVVITGSAFFHKMSNLADQDILGRFRIWQLSVAAIGQSPWLGWGLGTFPDLYPLVQPADLQIGNHKAPSTILEWMLDLGIPAAMCGFATVLVPVAICLRGCWRRRTDRYLPAVAFAASMVAILHSVVDFSLQIPAIGFVVSALLGLGWAQAFRRTE
jgi:O-antigen ligase